MYVCKREKMKVRDHTLSDHLATSTIAPLSEADSRTTNEPSGNPESSFLQSSRDMVPTNHACNHSVCKLVSDGMDGKPGVVPRLTHASMLDCKLQFWHGDVCVGV